MYLRTIQNERSKAVVDLDERDFGRSLSGLPSASLSGKS